MKKIKISIRLFVITLAVLLFTQVSTFAATGKSNAVNVRVRQDASTDSEVIELLALDDVVEILGEEGDWYKVTFNGKTGYVSQSFINTNDNVSSSEENTSNENNESSEKKENETTESNNNEDEEVDNNVVLEEEKTDNSKSENVTNTNMVYKMAENSQINILPIITSESIGEVKKNEDVTLVINAGLWVYIQTDKIAGWVRIDKLSTENVVIETSTETKSDENEKTVENTVEDKKEENTSDDDKTEETSYTSKTMYVKAAAINVRSNSNTDSDIVTSIEINTEVKVVGEENGWYKVEVNGKNGYIRNDLLSNEKTEVTSRSNNVDRTATQANVSNQTNTNSQNTDKNSNVESTQVNDNATSTKVETQATETSTSTTTATTETKTTSSGVTGDDIVAYAKQFVGCKYVYGAAGPNSFDCSGLTMYVYKHFGYNLSHSSKVQATQGKAVTGELQAGDILVFSNDGKTVGHVGIYIGNEKFIHASDSSTGVIISNLSDRWNKSKYWGARRIL